MRFSVLLGSVCVLALVGCGEDEEENPPPANDPAEVNPAVAQAATQSMTGAIQLAQSGDGMAAAFALTAVGTSAFSMVTPTGQSAPQSATVDGSAQQALTTGVCECTETSCTFDGCGDDGSPFTISGSISWTATSLQCDLSFGGSSAGGDYTFDQECDLSFSETSLDGTFRSVGNFNLSASGQSVTTDWESDLEYHSVTLSNGCPTGGSVDVTATVSASGQTYSGSGSVSFDGTGC
jgi:hypothetical protein